jgi:hypothetical protein
MKMENRADLYNPIVSTRIGPPPVVIRAIVTHNNSYVGGGVPQAAVTGEDYILLSALPRELQDRVKTAVQAIISGM